jgi:hypothetical protein
MFQLAERWGMRTEGTNPCRHVKYFRENRRQRYLSEIELARLGSTIAAIETEGRASAGVIAAIRLLILTGARRGFNVRRPRPRRWAGPPRS